MPLLFIAMQKSKTPLSIAERGFLRCLAERFYRNYCKTLSIKVLIINENRKNCFQYISIFSTNSSLIL